MLLAALLSGASLATGGIALGASRAATRVRHAVQPPTILDKTLRIASSHSPTAVTISVEVNPNGSETTVFLRYGTTLAYREATVRQAIGSGTVPVAVHVLLDELRPNTVYHAQFVATSTAGQATSGDLSYSARVPSSVAVPVPATSGGATDRVQAVPVAGVPRSSTVLNGVSCATTTFCIAVGAAGALPRLFRPLVESWGGRAFAVAPSPTPEGGELVGISCRAQTFCIAVGLDGIDAYSELWNGTSWEVLATPSPHTIGRDLLTGISCISRTDCWSVGVENAGTAHTLPLVERWNGARWSLVTSPAVPTPQLVSVDCPSASSCWIVGMADTAAGVGRPLVEHWNGRAVALGPEPAHGGQLLSISCYSPTSCVAAGAGDNGGFLISLSGGAWHSGLLVANVVFAATACPSVSNCFAAGGLTAHWNGRAWALGRPAEAYASTSGAQIHSLSCPTPRECVGVAGSLAPISPGAPAAARHAIADVITS